MRPTPRAPCCSTSAAAPGTRRAAASCSASRRRCCRRCATAPPNSADRAGAARRRRCRSAASPATSRRRRVGQACFAPGMVKSTYGTGCFVLLNTGDDAGRLAQPAADHRRLAARRRSAPMRWRARSSSPARRCNGCATGSALIARRGGDAARWRRRPIPAQAVYLVPAFVGLGAPYWDAEARGAIFGLTRATGPRGARPRGAGERRLPDPRPARGDAAPIGRGDGRDGAARRWRHGRLATGRCSSSPTCSAPRSTGRWCWRRRRSARPIWPGCRPASARRPAEFASALAAANAASCRRWRAAERERRLCRLAGRGAADAVRGAVGQKKGRALADPPPSRVFGGTPTSSPSAGSRPASPGRPGCSARLVRADQDGEVLGHEAALDRLDADLLQRVRRSRSRRACRRTGRDRPGRGSRRRSRRSGWSRSRGPSGARGSAG